MFDAVREGTTGSTFCRSGLVRSFSDRWKEEEPEKVLSQSLASKIDEDRNRARRIETLREQWNLLFVDAGRLANEAPDEERALLEQSGRLAQSWERFASKLPEDQRESVRGSIPDLTVVRDAVRAASITWQDKRDFTKLGKVKEIFAKVNQSCDDHSSILSMFPKNDWYTSLIAGSLSAIAKATINHQSVAEAISDTLNSLCDEINYCKRLVSPHKNNPEIMRWVRELYIVVFELLTDIFTKWSARRWDRFLGSFDKTTFDNLFTSKQQRIKDITSRLEREANLSLQEKLGNVDQNLGVVLQENSQIKELFSQIGSNGQKFLEELDLVRRALVTTAIQAPTFSQTSMSVISNFESEELLDVDGGRRMTYSRTEILHDHPRLQELLLKQDGIIRQLGSRTSHLKVDERIARHISAWTRNIQGSCLWIQGPAHMASPSNNTLTAACIVASAEKSELPVLSYFCRAPQVQGLSRQQRLHNMLESLTAQAIRFVPEDVHTDIDLTPQRLETTLNESSSTMDQISLLQDIVSLIPTVIFYVVDSLQALEQVSNESQSLALQEVLSFFCRGSSEGPVSKVCVTTDGQVRVLNRAAKDGLVDKLCFEDEAELRWGDGTASLRDLKMGRDGKPSGTD